jgi:DNA-binding NarL/FixJ family response regulator
MGFPVTLGKSLFTLKQRKMPNRNVLLVCSQHLFGESLESLLLKAGDLDLIGPWNLNEDICDRMTDLNLNVVVIADEDPNSEEVVKITNTLMQRFPDLPVIRTGLTHNMFYVVETHALPARGSDLIETIRGLPVAHSNTGSVT